MCCFHDEIGFLLHMLLHLPVEMYQPVCTSIWASNCVSSAGEWWFIKAQGHLDYQVFSIASIENLILYQVLSIAVMYGTSKCEIKQKCTSRGLWFVLEPQKWSHLGTKCDDLSWNWRLYIGPKLKQFFLIWKSLISQLTSPTEQLH